ncbi:MAG TPA: amino acid permease [Clostridia bacterium]|nr:amino acid permease [Clostridia bacterium]
MADKPNEKGIRAGTDTKAGTGTKAKSGIKAGNDTEAKPDAKGFKRNHLIIMALGNIIGSGIFLGSGSVISLAGPAAVLSYAIGGLIMIFEVMFITEMTIINPAPGSFRVHASEIFGRWMGFVNGWMFWTSGVLGMASEVAAAAIFTRLWLPHIPMWIFCIVYAALMTVINLADKHGLSMIESWLASIKVIALVLFILFGLLIIAGVITPGTIKFTNVFGSAGDFFPKGMRGVLASLIMVMFSFTGTGIIGLSIAEAEDPARDAPPAIYTITFSVIAIYCLSILFIILLTPWNTVSTDSSPFVSILHKTGIRAGGDILNFIVLTASLSGLNSSMYSASRMLNSLSIDKQGPKLFLVKNKNGVPVYALGLSSIVLMLTAIMSYILPSKVFIILAAASGFTAMFNWLTISVTHYFYRRKTLKERPEKLKFKAPGYPYTSVLMAVMIIMVFATSPLYEGQVSGLIGSLILFATLVLVYLFLKSAKKLR